MRLIRENLEDERRVTLTNPEDVYAFLRPIESLDRESFWRLDLDHRQQLIGCEEVSRGHLSGSLVHPREVYKGAILSSASSIVIAHNHPSGDPAPSPEDIGVTRRLYEAGNLLGILLTDHIIIGHDSYWSHAESGAEYDQ